VTPPRGILPRSLRERYHQVRRDTGAGAEAPEPEAPVGAEAPPRFEPREHEAPAADAPPDNGAALPPGPAPLPQTGVLAATDAPPPPAAAGPSPPPSAPRGTARLLRNLGIAAAVVLCAAIGIVVGSVVSSSGSTESATTAGTPAGRPPAAKPKPTRTAPLPPATAAEPCPSTRPLPLSAGATYDPTGTGAASGAAAAALDGKAGTAWRTTKAGVGVYVKLQRRVSPAQLIITTTTPGFTAEVLGSHHTDLPTALSGWKRLGAARNVKRRKAVKLAARGRTYRHLLLWVAALPRGGGPVKVTELQLR
jgi:hypothetical protein